MDKKSLSHSLFRPASLPILEQTLSSRTKLTVTLSHGLDGHSLAEKITGHVSSLSGNVAHLAIDSRKLIPTTHPAKFLQGMVAGDVSFNLTQLLTNGSVSPMSYLGEAAILEITRDRNGNPDGLILRFPLEFNARRLRRDTRYEWNKKIPATLGIDFVYKIPETRSELKSILYHCTENSRLFSFSPLNISAGGMCLLLPPHVAKTAAAANFFLFLSFGHVSGKGASPFFLIGKKLGFHYDPKSNEANGLRLQFTHELDLRKSSGVICWEDIESNGSRLLRNTLPFVWQTRSDCQQIPPCNLKAI